MKKRSDLSRLMEYAGAYRVFTYVSWVLSALSALVALVPFLYIWMILRDVLNAAPDYSRAVNIPHYGWMAVLFAALSYLIYVCALLCSHLSAFRVATNLRLAVSEPSCPAAAGLYGALRQRQAPQGHSGEHRRGGDLSCPSAAGSVCRHGHAGRPAGAAVRL